MAEAGQNKFQRDLVRFEQSVKEMQACLKTLNESARDVYGDVLPRAEEFHRGLQDQSTLVSNLSKDLQGVQDQIRRYHQEYDAASRSSTVASANRASEYISTVLGSLFRGQTIFFSEGSKVSQVLLDIVSQTRHKPSGQEARMKRELQGRLAEAKGVKVMGGLPRDPPGTQSISVPAGSHRGPGALVGGAFGAQKHDTRGASAQIKPASRFSASPMSGPTTKRIYI